MRITLIVSFLFILSGVKSYAASIKDGDIIFQTSLSSQSAAVQRATNSKYSHMGIILSRNGEKFVFEAVNPVKYTPLAQWIARGKRGHYVVKRLKGADSLLSVEAIRKIETAALQFEGKPYDLTFEWSDDRIYCSELIYKIYDRALGLEIGKVQRLREFNLKDPIVKKKLSERYGKAIPLDETVISPQAIFESSHLETVTKG